MTYEQLEAKLLAEFRKTFTEYHKGTSTPDGYIEPEWLVQADPEELQDWIRGALREVRDHSLERLEGIHELIRFCQSKGMMK